MCPYHLLTPYKCTFNCLVKLDANILIRASGVPCSSGSEPVPLLLGCGGSSWRTSVGWAQLRGRVKLDGTPRERCLSWSFQETQVSRLWKPLLKLQVFSADYRPSMQRRQNGQLLTSLASLEGHCKEPSRSTVGLIPAVDGIPFSWWWIVACELRDCETGA